ncbi:N-glycosylation protein-domain-containing protein, partial [Crucibulum laeve]
PICTTPGSVCAGETETETDEPSNHLPTARLPPPSSPLIPLTPLESKLTPFLFEFSRLLSIFPAIVGTLWNLWFLFYPPIRIEGASGRRPPERIDYFVAVLWVRYQCLALTTGLLTRWRLYYPPLSTLVRLLALQGICWPATQLGLTLFEHEKRPVVCWAVIGTTTCISRAVQIWVTSNLWWDRRERSESGAGEHAAPHDAWGGRRWDWREVSVKCVMPVAGVYFVMAWVEQVRRELAEGC